MRVSDVRKKYPEFFVTVEAAVWDDTDLYSPSKFRAFIPPKARKRIAYNAAAIAVIELHKIIIASRKNAKVAGKTVKQQPRYVRPKRAHGLFDASVAVQRKKTRRRRHVGNQATS